MKTLLHFTFIILFLLSSKSYGQIGPIIGTTTICQNDSTIFTDTTLNGRWYSSDTDIATIDSLTGMLKSIDSGTVIITYKVNNDSDTIAVTVFASPVPQIQVISLVLSTTKPYVTYQWYKDSVMVQNAVQRSYTLTANGSYYVAVTDSNGCSGVSKPFVIWEQVTTINGNNINIDFSPNPADNAVYITATVPVNVNIYSLDGREIIKQKNATHIDVSKLVNGVYIIHAHDKDGNLLMTDKLVKQTN